MLPPGLLVEGDGTALAANWPSLCALQPVERTGEGVVCAPRAAPELAGPALAACPLPHRRLDRVTGWPDPPARWLAGWYLRSPAHAPAPAGVRELVQAPGEGFGAGAHATTAMCLEAMEGMADGPALDAGCGSGLLAQAWARLRRGSVVAVDLDARALDQAARSLAAAGLERRVDLRRVSLGALAPADVAGRALLANLPAAAHGQLLARIAGPPAGAVLSGLRPGDAPAIGAAYRALGLVLRTREERSGFVCLALAAP